jgi:predicted amidohydrolase
MSSSKDPLSIEIVQKHHKRFDIDHNLGIIKEALRGSKDRLLIFPEMFLTGYTLGDDVHKLALRDDSPYFGEITDTCKDTDKFVIFGFPLRSSERNGKLHNACAVIGPEGLLGTYHKMHLIDFGPFEEWAYYTPGDHTTMVQIDGYNIGLTICYDIFFPELTKLYALNGADLIVNVSASPSVTRKFFEKIMVARAIENTVFFAYSNLVGMDSRMDFWGGGALISPTGGVISKGPYFEEASVRGEVDLHSLELSRKHRQTIRDTNISLLEELAKVGIREKEPRKK